ncbi:hypothetical protein MMC21_001282 [Puttea exsequens]|nr:hypothetical protein [Puttea exsequens]
MRGSITLLLVPATLALAGSDHHAHGHGRLHRRSYKSDTTSSGTALPTYTATGPYALGNETAGIAGSGTGTGLPSITRSIYSTITIENTIYETLAGPSEVASQAAASGSPGGESGPGESGDQCPAVVTVTVSPTITVTVTADDSPAESAAAVVTPSAIPEAGPPPTLSMPAGPASTDSALANAETAANIPENEGPTLTSIPAPFSSANSAPMQAYGPSIPFVQASSPSLAEAATSAAAAPAQAATTSAAAVPPPTGSTSSAGTAGSKRGIMLPAGMADTPFLTSAFNDAEKISWCGNWYSSGPPKLNSRIEFVPQNYGKDSDTDGTWTKNAEKAEAQGAKYFLSFGEPGTPNAKLYMDAQDAANLWIKEMQPYATKGVSVGAPGNLQNVVDFDYLTDFLAACDKLGCDIGFIAVHWFWSAAPGHVSGFKDVINNATRIANGKPVWLDNFQATGTNAAQQEFLGEVVPWLEQNEGVARYAYVSTDRTTGTGFLNADGSISSLGTYYANL